MSQQNLSQLCPGGKTTRRQFLKKAGGVALLAGLPPLPSQPNNERTAAVAARVAQFDRAITELLNIRQWLIDALEKSPQDVNGLEWYEFECRAQEVCERLSDGLDRNDETGDTYLALTGKTNSYWSIKNQIENGFFSHDSALKEIAGHMKRFPMEAAELLALAEARYVSA